MSATYVKDGAAIYRESFAIIRSEADLSRFSPVLSRVVVRMIHACGMTDLPQFVSASNEAAEIGQSSLAAGASLLCDSEMAAKGITRARLPKGNEVICTLGDPRVAPLSSQLGTTRSAAALELWRDRLAGAVVVIGNAPTALFRLLEMLEAGAPRPALIIGMPVGFVGAAESKEALAQNQLSVPYITILGRRGGSAMAAAAVNALASEKE
jgi:precorrin-8X/cobalt-precorrin-8 methylmutase